MSSPDLHATDQRYLKACWYVAQSEDISVGAVANRTGVSHASASTTISGLIEQGLVERRGARALVLTPKGETEALRLVRRHRLLETFLAEVLGFTWDEVHDEAERLEWVVSERFEEQVARYLGHPTRDPHGDPIPPPDGTHVEREDLPLAELAVGVPASIVRVSDEDPELLRFLSTEGLTLGQHVEVLRKDPFGGPLWISSAHGEHPLGADVVAAISVTVLPR